MVTQKQMCICRSEVGHLICSRHLFRQGAIANLKCEKRSHFPFHVRVACSGLPSNIHTPLKHDFLSMVIIIKYYQRNIYMTHNYSITVFFTFDTSSLTQLQCPKAYKGVLRKTFSPPRVQSCVPFFRCHVLLFSFFFLFFVSPPI